jgi:uncharacterized damage-inducible protein DinB
MTMFGVILRGEDYMKTGIALLFAASLLAGSASAQSQPPANVRDVIVTHWSDIGQKIIKMAEEFPEAKYDFKATKDVRTFADVLRHVAFWNQYVAKTARGEKADGSLNELPKAQYATKAKILEALKSSMAEATAELKKQPVAIPPKLVDLYTAFIGHSAEHYGQLVVYYRLNGVVPPASRSGDD